MTKELPDKIEVNFFNKNLYGLNGIHVNKTSLEDFEKMILSTCSDKIEIRGKSYKVTGDQTEVVNGDSVRIIFYEKI